MSRSRKQFGARFLAAAYLWLCPLVASAWIADAGALPAGSWQSNPSVSIQPYATASEAERVPRAVDQPYFDLDRYLESGQIDSGTWHWQLLPNDLIYKSYLAGMKESRSGSTLTYIQDDGWLWEGVLGARVGLLRYGDRDPLFPQGYQLDLEGAATVRLDIDDNIDVRSTDYRVGVPFTYGYGSHQTKIAYYHMSSHVGDEFLLAHPAFQRLNWSRDALVLGHSLYLSETFRLYAEAGWAFYTDVSEPWEFQFGLDWAPNAPTGFRGSPFFAANVHLREEVDFGGNLSVMTGWAWMSDRDKHLLRLGLHYYNGASSQYSFYNRFEEQIGAGFWYDF